MNRTKSTKAVFRAFLALTILAFSQSSSAQAVNGTLLGTVTDPTGAAVANAKVIVTETGTAVKHDSQTNTSGNYTFPDLPPGHYTVTVDSAGFKKSDIQNIELTSNSSQRIDVSLTLGSTSETVTVTQAPPEIQTDRADISTRLSAQVVSDMPLSTGRNFQSLMNLVPGVAPVTFQSSQFFNAGSTLQTEVNGLPREQNVVQIEGIDDNERTGQLQMIIPPSDAIASVDISTNNYDAELGRANGGVTNVTLKSGTNQFHGSAFEINQNNSFAARSYFTPSTTPLGHLSYNYFGGSIGGPILKNKLFIFGDFLRTVDHELATQINTIPDARYYTPTLGLAGCADPLGCINLAPAISGTKGQVFDPATGNGQTVAQGGTPRTAFAGNLIPFSRVNPVSLKILQDTDAAAAQYGTLNSTLPLSAPTNNFTENLPFQKSANSFNIKSDYVISARDHLSARYSFVRTLTYQAPTFGAFLGGPASGAFEGNGVQQVYSTGINYEHIFSPTFFTEARVGVAHLGNHAVPADYGSNDATTIGIPGVNINQFTSGQAYVSLADFTGPIVGYSISVPWVRAEANIDMVNNWTKIHGNHTIKWGADVRRIHDDLLQDQTYGARGEFLFGEAQTGDASKAGLTNIANSVASFLLDQPNFIGRDVNTYFPQYRQWWVFLFGTDKWQATPKLTFDLGLRWEFYPPGTPKVAGAFSNYNPTNNTLVIAGVGGNPSNLGMQTRYNYFAPRTGMAYRATEKTVVRAGLGISYTPIPDNSYAYNYPVRANNGYGMVGTSPYTSAVLSDGVTVPTFQTGFPAPVPVPVPTSGIIHVTGNANLTSSAMTYVPLNYKNPHAISWNVALQQALPWNLSAQLAYVANHGTDMASGQSINQPNYYGGGAASDPENHDANGNLTFGRTVATTEYFLPFSSNYQSLQAQLTKRTSQGLSFGSAFTWGKGLNYITSDDSGLTFFVNLRRNYAPEDWDRKFNFEQSFTYELPFGHGKPFLNSNWGNAVAGGWKISGIISIVSGTPFTISASGTTLNTPGTTQTATLTGPFTKTGNIGSTTPWFNTSVFSQPTGCTATPCPNPGLGNTGRNQFRGPGYIQDNASISKQIVLFREIDLEARIDAFQLSNTPQFANPNGTLTSTTFGTITGTVGSGSGNVNGVGGARTLQGGLKLSF
jgi:hypothetical protein